MATNKLNTVFCREPIIDTFLAETTIRPLESNKFKRTSEEKARTSEQLLACLNDKEALEKEMAFLDEGKIYQYGEGGYQKIKTSR